MKIKLDHGGSFPDSPRPVIELIKKGAEPYLWIGDESGACFGTLDIREAKRLAERILPERTA